MRSGDKFHADWIEVIDACRTSGRLAGEIQAASDRGFAVYVNTGLRALVDALTANFPSVAGRVGEARFHGLAILHARQHPAADARLFLYGSAFPEHLRSGALHEDGITLAAIAELDRAWMLAHVAADDEPLNPRRWSAQSPLALAGARLRPAPATFWLKHAELPIWDLWTDSRMGRPRQAPYRHQAQAVLITRPGDEVLSCEIDAATCAFLSACGEGLALADAAAGALNVAPHADLQHLLSRLFTQGAFTADGAPDSTEVDIP